MKNKHTLNAHQGSDTNPQCDHTRDTWFKNGFKKVRVAAHPSQSVRIQRIYRMKSTSHLPRINKALIPTAVTQEIPGAHPLAPSRPIGDTMREHEAPRPGEAGRCWDQAGQASSLPPPSPPSHLGRLLLSDKLPLISGKSSGCAGSQSLNPAPQRGTQRATASFL